MNYENSMTKIIKAMASLSKAQRKKVGAIITIKERIVSSGYNGTPPGESNICETNGITKSEVIHAEANAIMFANKIGINLNGAIMYTTLSPCKACANLIIKNGIKKIFFLEEYRCVEGIQLCKKNGVECIKIERRKDGNI